jgi:PAS domain S-box-containing protein
MDDEALRTLLDHTQDKLVVVDAEGTYRYANAAMERILGYDHDSFIGTNTFEYIHEADREDVRRVFDRLVAAEEDRTETETYRHRAADGSWVWLESRMWNRSNSELGGYVVSSRDVTARKEAQRRQRETEDRLRQLAANTDDVLWMFTADWEELLFVNEAFEELWGISRADLRADPTRFLDGIYPDDRPRVRRAMERLSSGEPIEMEYRVNKELSFRRCVWVRGHPVVEDGEVTKVVGFARDITDRRRRERQLQVLDNLLRHNVRNTMNVVLGNAALAREYGGSDVVPLMDTVVETGAELLDTVEKERRVVDALVDAGDPVPTELPAVLEDALADVRDRYPDATIEAEIPEAVSVVAVPELRDAIRELLENAIEHADRPCPEVELVVDPDPGLRSGSEPDSESEPESVPIQVRDSAPPIPGNEIDPLFADADPSAVYHGTGLGLWLVYWIVDICNGTLSFGRTADDTGNVVTVRLPRAA